MAHHNIRSGGANYLSGGGHRDHGGDDYRNDVPHLSSHHGTTPYTSVPRNEKFDDADAFHHHRHGETVRDHMLKHRALTDVHCCCFFILFLVLFLSITQYAWTKGDPRRLYHGFDYQGHLCGVDPAVKGKDLLYWPNPHRLDLPICVKHCPTDSKDKVEIPTEKVVETKGSNYERTEILRQEEQIPTMKSRRIGGRFCLPTQGSSTLAHLSRKIIGEEGGMSFLAVMANTFKDLTNAWPVLVLVLPISCGVCYIYFFLLKSCARVLLLNFFFLITVVTSIVAFYCLIFVGWNLARAEEVAGTYSDHPRMITGGIGWLSFFIALGTQVALWGTWNTLDKSALMIQAATDSMWRIQMMLAQPMLEIMCKLAFTIAWMINFSFVISNGDVVSATVEMGGKEIHGLVTRFTYTLLQKCHIAFYILGYIWTFEVITLIFKFGITYVLCHWYFTLSRDDNSKPEVTSKIWHMGFKCAFCSHFGSLTLGALLLSLFFMYRPIEALLDFLIVQSKKVDNPVANAMEYSCTCCTVCIKEVMCAVNKSAIVEMTLRGNQDFFSCARAARTVIQNAEPDIQLLQGLTTIYHMMGLLFVSMTGAGLTYWITGNVTIFNSHDSEYFLESRIGVCIVAAIMCGMVATVFMFTLEMVADCLIFCWLVEGQDDRMHTLFAPKLLKNLIFDDIRPKRHGEKSIFDKEYRGERGDRYEGYRDRDRGEYRDRGDRRYDDDNRSDGGWSNSSHLTKNMRMDDHGNRGWVSH